MTPTASATWERSVAAVPGARELARSFRWQSSMATCSAEEDDGHQRLLDIAVGTRLVLVVFAAVPAFAVT